MVVLENHIRILMAGADPMPPVVVKLIVLYHTVMHTPANEHAIHSVVVNIVVQDL